jgi:glycine cleavage system H protein
VTPDKLLFAKTHEWIHLDRQGDQKVATVGISSFAVEALTDLVYIELPQSGRQIKRGEVFGEIESVKAVSDLYSPVDGEVVEANPLLTAKDPGTGQLLDKNLTVLHDDPYGRGWLVKVRLAGESGLDQLLDYAAYQKQCAEEGH